MDSPATFVGIDLRFGVTGGRAVTSRRLTFHEELARAFLGRRVRAVGAGSVLGVPLASLYREAYPLKGLKEALYQHGEISLAVVDLSDSSAAVRDNWVADILDLFRDSVRDQMCQQFMLILPYSIRRRASILSDYGDHVRGRRLSPVEWKLSQWAESPSGSVAVVSQAGHSECYPQDRAEIKLRRAFKRLQPKMKDSPEAAVRRGLVRRLGHFRSSDLEGAQQCRQFSFLIDRRTDQLAEVLASTVVSATSQAEVLLYDGGNSPWLQPAVAAAGGLLDKLFYPVASLETSSGSRTVADAVGAGRAVLIVDVINSAATVSKHLRLIRRRRISHDPAVIAAVTSGALQKIPIDGTDYQVCAVLKAVGQSQLKSSECPQCRLGLAETREHDYDHTSRIRPFDFWRMVDDVGWEAETDVPPERSDLGTVPRFEKMLDQYGDWLGYKMARRLDVLGWHQFSVVYVDQSGASHVVEKLRLRVPRSVQFVGIPADCVARVRSGVGWAEVIQESEADEWLGQLRALADTAILLVDVFCVSGGTFLSLKKLLAGLLGTTLLMEFPLVDRTNFGEDAVYECLYRWPSQTVLEGGLRG